MATHRFEWLIIMSLVATTTLVWAQDVDVGKSTYDAMCATCHGVDGNGAGPVSDQLKVAPADLTILAKKNGGVFPLSAVYEAIDGRKTIAAHGTREMPIWGAYSQDLLYPMNRFVDFSWDPEAATRARILAVIDYLNRIQQK